VWLISKQGHLLAPDKTQRSPQLLCNFTQSAGEAKSILSPLWTQSRLHTGVPNEGEFLCGIRRGKKLEEEGVGGKMESVIEGGREKLLDSVCLGFVLQTPLASAWLHYNDKSRTAIK